MAKSDETPEGSKSKGFAGLGKMVSDVDATIADAGKPTPKRDRQPAPNARDTTPNEVPKSSRQPPVYSPPPTADASTGKKWLIGFAAVVALILFIGYLADGSSNSTAPTQASSADYSRPSEPASSPAPARPTEARPAVGQNNVLAGAQLRYCVAEKIRLDAAETAVNSYDEVSVERFNSYVGDYNARCGEFRYRQGSLQSAERAMEPYRRQLEAEGRGRVMGSAPTGSNRPSGSGRFVPDRSGPDATVMAIQRRLNALGYDAGTADGLGGQRTVAAIRDFQRDRGVEPDGRATQLLLLQLSKDQAQQSAPSRPTLTSRDDVSASLANEPEVPASASRASADSASLLAQLSAPERESLESACSSAKYTQGPSAYSACVSGQLAQLVKQPPRPNLSGLSTPERESIESACSSAKYTQGPGAYNSCLSSQLQARNRQGGTPDVSHLTAPERESIESACSSAKYTRGPAAYNACLTSQLASLSQQGGRPSLATLTSVETESIESACSSAKYTQGPAAYNQCLSRQLAALSALPRRANLSSLDPSIRTSVESACSTAKYTQGPAAYNTCLLRQLAQL